MSDQHVAPQTHITGDANAVGHGKITLLIKAEGGSTIRGVVQQVFGGDYERLRDAYIHPWPVFERVKLDHFVGREWLLAEVDTFLRDHDRGYFILEAKAGLGKTTFLAWLARERGYIHHFTELAPGLDGVGRGLKNLATQLVLAYHLSAYEAEGVLPGAATRPDFMQNLLKQAAEQRKDGEKIVFVVDALDEAGTPYNQNVLGLPQVLPQGVFVIVSQRPVPVTLHVDTATTPRRTFPLTADSDENQADIRRFLERAATWSGIAQVLHNSGYTPEQFTTSLLEKCRGVWIYLHNVVHEIERGERSPLDLDALPVGMTQYYARYWGRWRDEDEGKWYGVYLPVLATLAAAQEAVTVERLAVWADVKLPERRLRRLLNERWRPFLSIAGEGQQLRYRFYHATLREFFEGRVDRENLTQAEQCLVDELVEATQAVHHRLAERYLTAWGGLDEGLPGLQEAAQRDIDEGYGLRHLGVHLELARRVEDLHYLLALETGKNRNAWYEARDAHDDVEGYLADIERAWRLAEEAYSSADSARMGKSIGLQNRYALIITSINSLAARIPPALLAALVEQRVWSLARGLAYARQVPDVVQRVETLTRLVPQLPEAERTGVLREALVAARGIKNANTHAEAITGLAPYLSEELICEALAVARAIKNKGSRAKALTGLVPYMSEAERTEALKKAAAEAQRVAAWQEYQDQEEVKMHTMLAPHLSKLLLDPAWRHWQHLLAETEATTGWFSHQRAKELAGLAFLLVELGHPKQALAAVRKIGRYEERLKAKVLVGLAPHLPKPLLQKALAAARAIGLEAWRAEALVGLAPHLPEPLLSKALAAAREIEYEGRRAEVLAALAPRLAELGRPKKAFVLVRKIGQHEEQAKAKALAGLAPWLPEPLLQEALAAAREIGWEEWRAEALIGLVPHLPEPLRELVQAEALSTVLAIRNTDVRAQALASLVPHLPEPLKGETLQTVLTQIQATGGYKTWWVEALKRLAPHLPESLLQEALSVMQAIRDKGDQAQALVSLALYLPNLPESFLREALAASREIEAAYSRAKALAALVPHMSGMERVEVLQEAIAAALAIRGSNDGIEVLRALVPYLSEPSLRKALAAAQAIADEYYRVRALATLASNRPELLEEEVLQEALAASQRIWLGEYSPPWANDSAQALALEDLAPYLSEPLLQEALAAARQIGTEWARADALMGLAPHLPEELKDSVLREALAAVRATEDRVPRVAVLTSLAPHLPERLKDEVLREALAAVQKTLGRYEKAPALARLAPHLSEPLLQEALTAVREIKDVREQAEALIGLIPHLPESLLGEANVTAQAIGDEKNRVQVLAVLLSHLSQPLKDDTLQKALAAARAVRDEDDRARLLVALLPHLPEHLHGEVLLEALHLARAIDRWEYSREQALLALALHLTDLSPATLYHLWCETLHILAARARRDLLSDLRALAPVIAALGSSEAVAETLHAIHDVGRWWP